VANNFILSGFLRATYRMLLLCLCRQNLLKQLVYRQHDFYIFRPDEPGRRYIFSHLHTYLIMFFSYIQKIPHSATAQNCLDCRLPYFWKIQHIARSQLNRTQWFLMAKCPWILISFFSSENESGVIYLISFLKNSSNCKSIFEPYFFGFFISMK